MRHRGLGSQSKRLIEDVPRSHHLRHPALAGLLLLLLLLPAAPVPAEVSFPRGELRIDSATGSHRLTIELATTPEQQRHGLMFRTSMPADHGMLFDFHRERPVSMWMRNTFIPLDMVFIRSDGTIHHIALGTTPLSDSPIGSEGPVRAVLEVNAGTAERLALAPGDRVRHPIFDAGRADGPD
jgi:uncharacterized protein